MAAFECGHGCGEEVERDGEVCEYCLEESREELTGFEEHLRDSVYDPYERCQTHGEVISNGMFDGVCGGCEAEMEGDADGYAERRVAADEHLAAERARLEADDLPF